MSLYKILAATELFVKQTPYSTILHKCNLEAGEYAELCTEADVDQLMWVHMNIEAATKRPELYPKRFMSRLQATRESLLKRLFAYYGVKWEGMHKVQAYTNEAMRGVKV